MTARATEKSSPSPRAEPARNDRKAGSDHSFDWEALVPAFVHPTKIAILEAMLWIGMPLSATDLTGVFGEDEEGLYLGTVSYHLRNLHKVGILEHVDSRHVRGALEKFYIPVVDRFGGR